MLLWFYYHFLSFLFYSSYLLSFVIFLLSFLPSLFFFFLLPCSNFGNAEGKGWLSVDHSKAAASVPEAVSSQTCGVCRITGNSFPITHWNPVLFLWNNALYHFFTACSRHESHLTRGGFFFISVRYYFPHCIQSQVLCVYFLYSVHWCKGHKYFAPHPNSFLLTFSRELEDVTPATAFLPMSYLMSSVL